MVSSKDDLARQIVLKPTHDSHEALKARQKIQNVVDSPAGMMGYLHRACTHADMALR